MFVWRVVRLLAVAERMIALFDEFDEMARNRADSDEILSRFLTTAMSPKLAQINKSRRILFVVATNYIETFDLAVARPGRFDLTFRMMPPTAHEKSRNGQWQGELAWLESIVASEDAARAAEFEEKLSRLTYLETDKLVTRIKDDLGRDPARRDVGTGLKIWNDTLEECTLHRPHEKRIRPGQEEMTSARAKELDTVFRPSNPDHLSWIEAAVADAPHRRLQ